MGIVSVSFVKLHRIKALRDFGNISRFKDEVEEVYSNNNDKNYIIVIEFVRKSLIIDLMLIFQSSNNC